LVLQEQKCTDNIKVFRTSTTEARYSRAPISTDSVSAFYRGPKKKLKK
jgi:hypothetical protein